MLNFEKTIDKHYIMCYNRISDIDNEVQKVRFLLPLPYLVTKRAASLCFVARFVYLRIYTWHDWQIAYFQTYVSMVAVCIVCVVALSALPNKHGTQALLWRDCLFSIRFSYWIPFSVLRTGTQSTNSPFQVLPS